MELTGTIKKVFPAQTGEGKNGKWVKQPFLVSTEGQYPKDVYIEAFGKVSEVVNQLQVNQKVKVSYNLESREYNGKWYTSVNIWKVESLNSTKEERPETGSIQDEDDSLPF